METHRLEGPAQRLRWPHPAVAIGNLDGVHRGHQALVAIAVRDARNSGGTPVALTFDPHPSRVLSPDRAPQALMTLGQKQRALAGLGVERLVVVGFDRRLAGWSAEDFVRRVLVGGLGAAVVVVGASFRFGREREGDPALLGRLGERLGFTVHTVAPVVHEGAPVSSTRIREAVARGAVEGAAALLGRPYSLEGRVGRGDGRGRSIGYPTANLEVTDAVLPARGVYGGWARADGQRQLAVLNVGHRPTFGAGDLRVELHLVDFEGDLYESEMEVEIVTRLRGEQAFASAEALSAQIAQDIEAAKRILGAA